MKKRNSFNLTPINTLEDDVLLEGSRNYSNNAFDDIIKNKTTADHANNKQIKNMGRPVTITDERMKVSVPKKVSPYTSTKLDALKPFMSELKSEKKRITFDQMINTLIDSYVQKNIGVSKEELFLKQFKKDFDKING